MLQYSRDWRVLVIGNWHPAAPIFIAPALHTARSKWGRLSRWIICSKYFLATFPFEWQWWIIFAFVCTCNLDLVSPLMYLLCIALRKHFLQQSGSIGLSALWRKSVTPFYELARVWECKHFWMIFSDLTRRSPKKRWERVSAGFNVLILILSSYLILSLMIKNQSRKVSSSTKWESSYCYFDATTPLHTNPLQPFWLIWHFYHHPFFKIRALKKSKVEEKQQDGGGR